MMTPDDLLKKVCGALDVLLAAADEYGGLFPSMIDRHTHTMLRDKPPAIDGQRDGDRAMLGSNLIHDTATLDTMFGLAAALGRDDYAHAANRYLHRFATHCTDTVSGLFPWGEHAYWHLVEDRVGNAYADSAGRQSPPIHDHLRQAPLWLWRRLDVIDPDCVQRFAHGLDNHWTEGEPREYIRHAIIDAKRRHPRGARSCDFPRHGGFYIFDWAFAYTRSEDAALAAQMRAMLDYWWRKKHSSGLLGIESRCPADDETDFARSLGVGQTLSLASSLLQAADLLEGVLPELVDDMRKRAAVYIDGFFSAAHDPQAGRFMIMASIDGKPLKKPEHMAIWGSRYGQWPACYVGLNALCAARCVPSNARLIDWAAAVGRSYLAQPMPEGVAFPAMDAGLAVELLADLYDITGDTAWRDGALTLGAQVAAVYLDADLPRGAAGIDWYESQMGPGFILHGLARAALLAADRDHCPLAPDYTAR